jgi:hypothetical protein
MQPLNYDAQVKSWLTNQANSNSMTIDGKRPFPCQMPFATVGALYHSNYYQAMRSDDVWSKALPHDLDQATRIARLNPRLQREHGINYGQSKL